MIDPDMREEYFEFLIELRDSGIVNMWGAAPYLQDAFPELTSHEARAVLVDWINSFTEEA